MKISGGESQVKVGNDSSRDALHKSGGGPVGRVSEWRPLVLTGLFRELQRPEGPAPDLCRSSRASQRSARPLTGPGFEAFTALLPRKGCRLSVHSRIATIGLMRPARIAGISIATNETSATPTATETSVSKSTLST